jgi:hypothetical protein
MVPVFWQAYVLQKVNDNDWNVVASGDKTRRCGIKAVWEGPWGWMGPRDCIKAPCHPVIAVYENLGDPTFLARARDVDWYRSFFSSSFTLHVLVYHNRLRSELRRGCTEHEEGWTQEYVSISTGLLTRLFLIAGPRRRGIVLISEVGGYVVMTSRICIPI